MKLVIGNKNYSTWSLRSWFLLKEAGIEFEEIKIPLDVESTRAEIAKYSLAGRVPVLLVDDHAIWDSLAIAESIAERFPEKTLWPADRIARATARSLSAEMHAGFMTLREAMPMNCRAMGRKVALGDALTKDIDRMFAIWTDCQQRFGSSGDWLFGAFSIVDAMYAPVVMRFRTYGINLPESASVYPRKLLESAAIQEWLSDSESETEIIAADEKGQ